MNNKIIKPEWVPSGYRDESKINMRKFDLNTVKAILFGVAVGDALGVPVEFKSREEIANQPVVDMVGYGSHNKPAGTFSDDSSMTFCLAESIASGFSLDSIAKNFINWRYKNYWTADGEVFDVGIATQEAIDRLARGIRADLAGGMGTYSNGNGSLMRILPLLAYIKDKPIAERYEITKQVSSITHAHVRSVIACFYYLEFASGIMNGENKFSVYQKVQISVTQYLEQIGVVYDERKIYNRLLVDRIDMIPEEEIGSSGYVVRTLEASIWCVLTTDNYHDAVLQAVNLGSDTDTTGAVTGGLAALLYGFESIPQNWINQIARKDDIEDLAVRLLTTVK